MELQNKIALVTGSSRGVGMRVARALGEKGCSVILHSRKKSGTGQLAAELAGMGVTVHQVAADLAEHGGVEHLIAEVQSLTGGKLDILYNNAAVMTPYLTAFGVPASDYELSFRVNVIAPVKLCDAFVPGMIERNWGRIVCVTSGIANQPELMAYSCSKAALDRYVRDNVPTLEGSDVLMNLMDPGWLRTDMGGEQAPNDPDTVLPGALVPVLLERRAGSGKLYRAQDYRVD